MDLIERIKAKENGFSKGQRKLADYILKEYDKAAFLTASKLGKEAGVSESTVVRFAYELDYDGYPELQKAMNVIVKTQSSSLQRLEGEALWQSQSIKINFKDRYESNQGNNCGD